MTDDERDRLLDSYRVVRDSRTEDRDEGKIIVRIESSVGHQISGEVKYYKDMSKYFVPMCVLKPDFTKCPKYTKSGDRCRHMYPSKESLTSWWAVQCFNEEIEDFVIRRCNLEEEMIIMKLEEV